MSINNRRTHLDGFSDIHNLVFALAVRGVPFHFDQLGECFRVRAKIFIPVRGRLFAAIPIVHACQTLGLPGYVSWSAAVKLGEARQDTHAVYHVVHALRVSLQVASTLPCQAGGGQCEMSAGFAQFPVGRHTRDA